MTSSLHFALALSTAGLVCAGCQGEIDPADAIVSNQNAVGNAPAFQPLVDADLELLVTPSAAGHTPFIDAINGATQSVHMVMFHLTDAAVMQALVAAHKRGVQVIVILDQSSIDAGGGYYTAYESLKSAKVDVIESSAAFTISHEKSMVVDGTTAFITAMNMTNDAATTRDFGVVTHDVSVIKEWNAVFTADVANAKSNDGNTPALSQAAMVWSPVSSAPKLEALIDSAKSTIIATTESINSPNLIAALDAAAQRGVQVRMIVPMCDQNPNPLLDYTALTNLNAHGVTARVMPYPATAKTPYMHSKMIVVDDSVAFVGSVNLTTDSTLHARELGIIFNNPKAITTITTTFNTDWTEAVTPPKKLPNFCPTVG